MGVVLLLYVRPLDKVGLLSTQDRGTVVWSDQLDHSVPVAAHKAAMLGPLEVHHLVASVGRADVALNESHVNALSLTTRVTGSVVGASTRAQCAGGHKSIRIAAHDEALAG